MTTEGLGINVAGSLLRAGTRGLATTALTPAMRESALLLADLSSGAATLLLPSALLVPELGSVLR